MKLFIFYFILLTVTGFAYVGVLKTYFRQDEWASLGLVLGNGPFYFGVERPLGTNIGNLFHFLFPFAIYPFIVYGMVVHTLNALLVYVIAKKMKAGAGISILAALLFVTSSAISQALTWFAATINTLGATFFLLLSILCILKYAETAKKKDLWGSFIFLFTSILFKESGLIGIILVPFVYVLYAKHRKPIQYARIFSPLVIVLALVLLVRIPLLLNTKITGFATHTPNAAVKILFHTAFYPFTSFSQQFIPRHLLFRAASDYQSSNYSFLSTTVLQSAILENVTSDFVSLLATLIIFALCFVVAVHNKSIVRIITFGLAFSLLSFLPYVVVNRGTSFLDSRYYYMGMVGGSIVLAAIAVNLGTRRLMAGIVILVAGLYMYKNVVFIQRDIRSLERDSAIQMQLLDDITSLYPDIGQKPVFYITGNTSYWGVDGLHVPLQAGPGYILMVWYSRRGLKVPELLRDFFLYDVRDQGYREASTDKGFGYYSDYDALRTDYKNGVFTTDQLYAIDYDGNVHQAHDISRVTREQVSK